MPGVRFDRFLASTAVAILLSGVTIGAFAEPKSGSTTDSAMAAPAAAAPVGPGKRRHRAGRESSGTCG